MTGNVAGLLLAAGQGVRLGEPKALVKLAGMRLVDRVVATLREGGASPLIAVTGAADVDLSGVITVHNPHWQSGMGSSLAAGLAAIPGSCAAVVIALVDQPLIGPGTVARLIDAYRAGAEVVVATYQGRPRNPVLIARPYWSEVAASAEGDVGARPFLRAHPEVVTEVECGDIGSADDVDTPADLARVERALIQSSFPGAGAAGPPAG